VRELLIYLPSRGLFPALVQWIAGLYNTDNAGDLHSDDVVANVCEKPALTVFADVTEVCL